MEKTLAWQLGPALVLMLLAYTVSPFFWILMAGWGVFLIGWGLGVKSVIREIEREGR
jgi:hypothetical protein